MTERVPFKICVMRLVGTPSLRASSASAHIERLQFFGQVLTWMNGSDWHGGSPHDNYLTMVFLSGKSLTPEGVSYRGQR